ncbi:MAG: PilC/PilY family type IV pilus protein [Pseudoxanthomonas suwonensis]|nr:PilC/PilY family type IV pilus protein [Pseudoxanthomonas suwonensis]
MHKTRHRQRSWLQSRLQAGVLAFLATLLSLPAVADNRIPSEPLITGATSVPPNILMILDDSGSMDLIKMSVTQNPDVAHPEDSLYTGCRQFRCIEDTPSDRSYVNNTIYYDPRKVYRPWRTHLPEGATGTRLPAASISAVSTSTSMLTGSRDLRGHADGVFYVPRQGVASPGTNAANYERFTVQANGQGAVITRAVSQELHSQTYSPRSLVDLDFTIPANLDRWVVTTSEGSGNGNLEVYERASNGGLGSRICDSRKSGNNETCSFSNPESRRVWVRIWNSPTNIRLRIEGVRMEAGLPWNSASGSQAAEIQNYANWYHYHRSRMKVAKAGASEAFGDASTERYRVGYDSIHRCRLGRCATRNSDYQSNTPALPIPAGSGLFTGANRQEWFQVLHGAPLGGGTPLHGALQRAGRYFSTDEPWKDADGVMQSCRSNYAILTTDGYWNSRSATYGYSSSVGNADGKAGDRYSRYPDRFSDTLADVAYEYWRNDLRPEDEMPDNVPTSSSNPANWQHMVTFGVSIGVQGTLNQNNPPPVPWNVNPMTREDATRIDDLWHATLNSRGTFVVANDAESFADALKSAMSVINARSASGSNVATTSTRTDTSTQTFVASYRSGDWTGDMISLSINAAGTGFSDTPNWQLSKTFSAGGVNAGFSNRKVFTTWGGSATEFNASMSDAAPVFSREGGTAVVSLAENIAYLKGDQRLEQGRSDDGRLRRREVPIGDIVYSSPSYVDHTNMVFIGANDGMLHGISSTTGEVRVSYVPAGIDMEAMASLSSPYYQHAFFVDGEIHNRRLGTGGNSPTLLVGALGRGGRGIYALNVADVASSGNTNAYSPSQLVLWDHTFKSTAVAADDVEQDMGHVLGNLRIVPGNGGKTYVLVPNGINSISGRSVLFVYEVGPDGKLVGAPRKLVANASDSNNGLMSIGLADLDGNGTVDTVYGGDLKGNVWRWDFSGNALPTTPVRLFQAKDAAGNPQSITGGIGINRDPATNDVFIGFGTGRILFNDDIPGKGGTLYGLRDSATPIAGRDSLQRRTIPYIGVDEDGRDARGFESYSELPAGKSGWYLDLGIPALTSTGERVISAPTMYGEAMFITSVIPPAANTGCEAGAGSGYLNAINVFTGTSPRNNGFFTDETALSSPDQSEPGVVGSRRVTGGMPTQAALTDLLAIVGTGEGVDSSEDASLIGDPVRGFGIRKPSGGDPRRLMWREVMR